MNRKNLLDAYEHLNFKDRFNKKVSFIHAWLKDEYIRKYTDVNTYPPPIKCPADIYNTWKPFAMEFVTDYEESDITPLLHHIKILSNHNEAVYTYIIEWIAHMVQLPAEKTTMIVLVGKEGNGKGTLMKVIQKMLGSDKYMETTKPERDVFGNFNGQMAQSYFVHLSELNKKQSADSMDVIKGLITDTALVINQKGKDAFTIDSYHRFFVATNHTEGGIKTYQGDRRKLVAKASDEKIGDSDYFIEMNRYIEDVNYMKSLYEYFKRYEGVANFRNKPIPVTEFQQDLYSLNESPILSYIKDLVSETDVDTLEIPTKEFYTGFNTFLHSNKIHYDVTEKLFTLRLKDITQNIGKKHTRKGMSKILDIVKLRKEFNLGCLIEA